MAENKLADMSTEFAIQILKLTDGIRDTIPCLINLNEAAQASVQIFARQNMHTAVPILSLSCRLH